MVVQIEEVRWACLALVNKQSLATPATKLHVLFQATTLLQSYFPLADLHAMINTLEQVSAHMSSSSSSQMFGGSFAGHDSSGRLHATNNAHARHSRTLERSKLSACSMVFDCEAYRHCMKVTLQVIEHSFIDWCMAVCRKE